MGLFGNTYDYGGDAANREMVRQWQINNGIANINKAFQGFDSNFYKKRQKAYVDYAMPQLGEQYRQNKDQLGYNMANRGIMGSSMANRQTMDLNTKNRAAQMSIADAGLAQAQQLQQQVENQKNLLRENLYVTADPANAGRGAIATAAGFSAPSVFKPVANMFGDIANAYYLGRLINSYKPDSTTNDNNNQEGF